MTGSGCGSVSGFRLKGAITQTHPLSDRRTYLYACKHCKVTVRPELLQQAQLFTIVQLWQVILKINECVSIKKTDCFMASLLADNDNEQIDVVMDQSDSDAA